ncbi:MAG: hypothetical protein MUF10_03135 [Thermoanaerobaculaceae bacterium]|nr:hypothetical protein [Thermoanaerobaculaceae bacterium]
MAAYAHEALPTDHKYARALHSGQTVTGTFVADGDPDHRLQDYNLYYIPGTAGSHIRVTLERGWVPDGYRWVPGARQVKPGGGGKDDLRRVSRDLGNLLDGPCGWLSTTSTVIDKTPGRS